MTGGTGETSGRKRLTEAVPEVRVVVVRGPSDGHCDLEQRRQDAILQARAEHKPERPLPAGVEVPNIYKVRWPGDA
jgi:hypothetical protein